VPSRKIDLNAVRQECDRLVARDGSGLLMPAAVVEAARASRSVMHGFFEWDDGVAAEAHRQAQARQLIRLVRMPVKLGKSHTVIVPSFIRAPTSPARDAGYSPIANIASDHETAREVLVREIAHVSQGLHRARRLAQVFNLTEEVEVLIEGVIGLQMQVEEAK
jgi:hypothetical protein